MTHPDQLDLEALDMFMLSRVGGVYRQRVVDIAARHAKTCQDRRETIESIRASQGAIEAATAILGLPDTLRKELEARKTKK